MLPVYVTVKERHFTTNFPLSIYVEFTRDCIDTFRTSYTRAKQSLYREPTEVAEQEIYVAFSHAVQATVQQYGVSLVSNTLYANKHDTMVEVRLHHRSSPYEFTLVLSVKPSVSTPRKDEVYH